MTLRTVHMDFLYGGAFRDRLPGGVRAADPRLPARRRDAVHARGRGRGAVVARRRDRRRLEARPARVPELRGGDLGAGRRRRADATGTGARGDGTSAPSARSSASSARSGSTRDRRAVPAHERDDAHRVGAGGLGRDGRGRALAGSRSGTPRGRSCSSRGPTSRKGSRRASKSTAFRSAASARSAPRRSVCGSAGSGRRRRRAWSLRCCSPTCRSSSAGADLPPFGERPFEQLVGTVDRLIVDCTEWPGLPAPYAQLAEVFDRVAVSDIAWARTSRWRAQLASLWPGIADVQADRGDRDRGAGEPARRAGFARASSATSSSSTSRPTGWSASTWTASRRRFPLGFRPIRPISLSDELERFTRDRVYEDAVRATN